MADEEKKRRTLMPMWLGIFGFLLAAAIAIVLVFLLRPEVLVGLSGESSTPNSPAATPEASDAIIEQLKFLLGGLALGLTAIVLIQTIFQARHDKVQQQGAEQVSSIMTVVRDTLKSRLDAEIEERQKAAEAEEKYASVAGSLELVKRRLARQDEIIARERKDIEDKAEQLANNTARHDFSGKVAELTEVARQYDTFRNQFEPLDESGLDFTARVLYIRGIAAHYNNDPTRVIDNLTPVTTMIGGNEQQNRINRRIGNAYYYLGVTHANFGHVAEARDNLNEALTKSADAGDYLTRVVFAEALAAVDPTTLEPAPAVPSRLADPKRIAADIAARFAGKAMPDEYRHLRSRALLVAANSAIRAGQASSVKKDLMDLHDEDPEYFYATITLAQVLAAEGSADAAPLFREAYTAIRASNNLNALTEARSKILLHMSAALCLHYGAHDTSHAEDHLYAVQGLLPQLPKLGDSPYIPANQRGETCTVYSVLSKRNESAAGIEQHLRDIRAGRFLLV